MPGHQAQSHDDDATKTVNDVPNASDAKSTQGSSHGDKAVTDEAPSTDIGDGGDAAQDAPAESKKDTYGDKSDAGEDTVDNQDDIARSSLMQELFARLKAHEVPGKSTDDYGPEDLASIFGHEVMAHHSEAGSNPVSEESRGTSLTSTSTSSMRITSLRARPLPSPTQRAKSQTRRPKGLR